MCVTTYTLDIVQHDYFEMKIISFISEFVKTVLQGWMQ